MEYTIIGTVDVTTTRLGAIKQQLGFKPKKRLLSIPSYTAGQTMKICEAIRELKTLDTKAQETLTDQIAEQLPLMVHIIAIGAGLSGNEAQEVKQGLIKTWQPNEIAAAVGKIYSRIDFDNIVLLFESLGKIKATVPGE